MFEFRKGLTIRILGGPKDLLRAKESIMVATVSGITSAELVIVTDTNSLDVRDASVTTLNNIVNRLEEYIDFETFKTNNLSLLVKVELGILPKTPLR